MAAVAEGENLGFTAAAGPDRAVFFNLHRMRGFARSLVGAVTKRRILGLVAGAKGKGLAGFGVDFVREGLPAHGLIIPKRGTMKRRLFVYVYV